HRIEDKFDAEAARLYAEANQTGLEHIASLADEMPAHGVDCRFERRSALTCTFDGSEIELIHREAEAARRAGLPATATSDVGLPFPVPAAVRVENQAQFHPYRYCVGLARLLTDAGGRIFENVRAQNVSDPGDDGFCKVELPEGELRARHVLIATLLPFLDRGGYFAQTHPSRSYGIVASLDESAPEGMYINVETPVRSVRPMADGRSIIVVGEEHKVGQDDDTRDRYGELEAWTRQHFAVRSVDHRWSAQDNIPVDDLPYIGPLDRETDRIWTATGFNKWGLTTGSVAALILKDRILGKQHRWAELFNSTRVDVLPSAKEFLTQNLNVAARYVGDRLKSLVAEPIDQLAPGNGAIVELDGQKVAAYRDDAGNVHACSPICTHLGCYVQWNRAERSWDCPCHGSRFATDGQILQGPALDPLEKVEPSGGR
ncbi:MAG: FAD-dependent oxidoreductase, partial [Maioricimonas sp. JB049]